jgi:hypothetical protein
MPFPADIVVESRDGEPLLIVEPKNRTGLDDSTAAAIRRNLVDDYGLSETPAPAFLLLSQERGFLWTGAHADRLAPAPYQFSMTEVVRRYLPSLAPDRWLWGDELGLVVVQWLHELIGGTSPLDTEAERTILDSGLLASLRGGRVVEEIRV